MYVLSEEDKEFIQFWETEGKRRGKWTYMLKHNLPRGLIFGAPIAIFFFLEAGRHRGIIDHGDLIIIMAGILAIAVFYAIFYGYYKLDQYQSHYQILKMKQSRQAEHILGNNDEGENKA